MAQQQDGWPLGLRPGFGRNLQLIGGYSSNALLSNISSSNYSNDSSSHLHTQAKASVFQEESTTFTFGSLIGVTTTTSNIVQLSAGKSRRSFLMTQPPKQEKKKSSRSKTNWFLCSKLKTDAVGRMNNNNAPSSLGHFLQVERRHAASFYGSNNHQGAEFTKFLPASDDNSVFIAEGNINTQQKRFGERSSKGGMVQDDDDDDYATPLLLSSCLCCGDPKTH